MTPKQGKSKVIKSGPGTWGTLASQSGKLGPGPNVNQKNYHKPGQTATAPSLTNNMNPMKCTPGGVGLKGV
jgi:hypothetical protein